MKDTKTKHHIEVEGVILTEKAIIQLKAFQDSNNEDLNFQLENIANAICYIASRMYNMEDEKLKDAAMVISNLSCVRDNIIDLKKP